MDESVETNPEWLSSILASEASCKCAHMNNFLYHVYKQFRWRASNAKEIILILRLIDSIKMLISLVLDKRKYVYIKSY